MSQKFELFCSIVEHYIYPEWVDVAVEVSDEVLQKTEQGKGHVKHGASLHGEPKLRPLVDTVGQSSKAFLVNQGYNLDGYSLIFESFWPQVFSDTGYHETHTHSNSHISGFYFLKCSPNSSYPIFYDPRFGKNMIQLPEKDDTVVSPISNRVHFKPVPGSLVIFNSFLPHSFTINLNSEPFQFIHFTMIALPNYYLNQK